MAEEFGAPLTLDDGGSKKKTWIIILVVVIVLCCCLVVAGVGGYWLWNNGDDLFGLAAQFSHLLL